MATCEKCGYDGHELRKLKCDVMDERDKLDQHVSRLETERNQLKARVTVLEAERDELKEQVGALEWAIGTAVKDVTDSLEDLESYVG